MKRILVSSTPLEGRRRVLLETCGGCALRTPEGAAFGGAQGFRSILENKGRLKQNRKWILRDVRGTEGMSFPTSQTHTGEQLGKGSVIHSKQEKHLAAGGERTPSTGKLGYCWISGG